MPLLPSNQTVSPLGQLAAGQQGQMPDINPDLLHRLIQYAMASMATSGGNMAAPGAGAPNQQQQQQQQAQQQNPGLGGLSYPNMSPQNTGLTPQLGQQLGQGLRGLFTPSGLLPSHPIANMSPYGGLPMGSSGYNPNGIISYDTMSNGINDNLGQYSSGNMDNPNKRY